MNKTLAIFLFTMVALLFPHFSNATHMAGGEMTYSSLGNNKFLITATIYRDCRGISFNGPTFGVYAGTNGGNACGSSALSCTRISITDVTPRCSTGSSPCSPTNTYGTGEGIEAHVFTYTADFSQSPLSNFVNNSSCCEVTFYIGQCCRNGAITTGPAGSDFYVTCSINICNIAKCKNKQATAPKWKTFNNFSICCNQALHAYIGGSDDVDKDSIAYKLVPGTSSLPGGSVTYASPFSYQYPMTPRCNPPTTIKCKPDITSDPPIGFYFDTTYAELIFTPTKCDEVGIFCYEMYEYRKDTTGKYVFIGKSKRDLDIIVKDDCGINNSPQLIFDSQFPSVCEGDTLKLNMVFKDIQFKPYATKPDTITSTYDNSIKGSTFNTLVDTAPWIKTYQFILPTKKGDAGQLKRAVWFNVTDNHCPKPSITSDFISVKILKQPDSACSFKYSVSKCNNLTLTGYANGTESGGQFTWSLQDSLKSKAPTVLTGKTATYLRLLKGIYKLKLTVKSNIYCERNIEQFIHIDNADTVFLGADTAICARNNMIFYPRGKLTAKPVKYYWLVNNIHSSGDTLSTLELKNPKSSVTVNLTVTDTNKCTFSAQRKVTVNPLPKVSIIGFKDLCPGDVAILDAGHKDTMLYNWSSGDTKQKITVQNAGKYFVQVTNPKTGCFASDTGTIFVKSPAKVALTNDTIFCENVGHHDLTRLLLLDTAPPVWNYFSYKIKAFNGDTNSSKIISTTLRNGYQIPGSAGLGNWTFQYSGTSQGCPLKGILHAQIVPAPTADFSFNPDPATNANTMFDLVNTSSISDGSTLRYHWDFGQGSGDTSIRKEPYLILPDRSKLYAISLTVTSIYGCSTTTTKILANYVSSNKIQLPDDLKMNEDLIFLGAELKFIHCKIYDLSGKIVLEFNNNNGLKKNAGNRMQQGLYMYRIGLGTADGREYFITGKTLIVE